MESDQFVALGLEARTQRRIGILKWTLTLGLAAGIIVLLSAHPWSWLRYL